LRRLTARLGDHHGLGNGLVPDRHYGLFRHDDDLGMLHILRFTVRRFFRHVDCAATDQRGACHECRDFG
jgi:hypothetical protein